MSFLADVEEDADHNQYWYSQPTIDALVKEVEAAGGACAFLSTPSLYFSIPEERRAKHYVFDYDGKKFGADPRFVLYDFHKPEELPADLLGTFDVVVIDPPFITKEVWELYAQAAKLLLKASADGSIAGKVIGTTIVENAPLLEALLGCKPQRFLPSIPHLVYQYTTYCNFEPTFLSQVNPEIPE